jgi:hypothetical protein
MQSTTTADPTTVAALPLEQRVTVAADKIARTLALTQTAALRELAAVYQRASLHTTDADLIGHLIQSAMCARRLAIALEEATTP